MNWFGRLTVGRKLTFGFAVMIIFMAVIGAVGFRSLTAIQANLEDMFQIRLPSLDYLLQADRDLQQLLVAERSLIFAEAGGKAFEKQLADYETNLRQSTERWNKYKALVSRPEEKELLPLYESARAQWEQASRKVVEACKSGDPQARQAAMALSLGQVGELFEAMRDHLDKLQDLNLDSATADNDEATGVYNQTMATLSIITLAGVGLAILLALVIGRGVTKRLNAVITRLAQSSQQVASASAEVNKAGQSLAQGSSQQAAALEQVSASLEQMASMTNQNADNARLADDKMKSAAQIVATANQSMASLRQAMEAINAASGETAKIVKTIDEIAFQTNLLALNAAVEAARAGEAGAGFAVVADEVRSLAQRAAEAARTTAQLIEESIRDIKNGGSLVLTTDEAFNQVASSAGEVGGLVGEIAAASSEQAQGIGQVNRAMSDMDKVTQQNAANAEQSAAAAEELAAQSDLLRGLVSELAVLVERRADQRPRAAISGDGDKKSRPAKVKALPPADQGQGFDF